MKKTSIYSAQSQSLRQLFEAAGQPQKVLCGALDYAKRTHTALFCDGRGDILRQPFAVHNNPQGVSYLLEALERSCRYHAINPKHVFFGGEDVGPFASNFVHALRAHGFLVEESMRPMPKSSAITSRPAPTSSIF